MIIENGYVVGEVDRLRQESQVEVEWQRGDKEGDTESASQG